MRILQTGTTADKLAYFHYNFPVFATYGFGAVLQEVAFLKLNCLKLIPSLHHHPLRNRIDFLRSSFVFDLLHQCICEGCDLLQVGLDFVAVDLLSDHEPWLHFPANENAVQSIS
jgi:hypothetical protein